jgi:Ca-activated chloride channel family protein
MKVNYTLSQSPIALNHAANVDLIVSFQGSDRKDPSSRRPLNLSLVLDRSGSMAGQPLRYAISAAQKLVEYLTPEDILSVVIYDDTPEVILPAQPIQNPSEIKKQIGKIRAGGCTNLSGGWLRGCDLVKANQSPERLNRVLLLTDGLANVGISDDRVLINTAKEKAEQGVFTTTLGFGNYFNEDLLIGMANAGRGNFYFIQSPDDAADVFKIEMESLVSVVAQNLVVTIEPSTGLEVTEILNNYRSQIVGNNLELFLGDVYEIEKKPLALALTIPPQKKVGMIEILSLSYQYQTVVDESIQQLHDRIPITIEVGSPEEASQVQPNLEAIEQTSQLRIAKVKDEAIALADRGDYQQASQKLREMADALKQKALQEFFAIAEEISQLEYYAQSLENRGLDSAIRKEMRDQSYQTRSRDRSDLKLRGLSEGAADSLEAVSEPGESIQLRCDRVGGKLRIKIISDGYDSNLNVQFPRSIREEGVIYLVDEVILSTNGDFYRVSGTIKRLVLPGQERSPSSRKATTKAKNLQTANATGSAADLETTDTVGDGVLVQCVKEGKKLRVRVVSDGYNPNYNIRFPRNIREEGILYVVDDVRETAQGGSYIAYGKIKKLVQ